MLGPKGVIFVGLYRKWFVIFSLLALTILFGCGKKLDTETLTMLENCDAACMGKVQTIGSQMVPIPEGTGLDCVETSDGMRLAMLLKIRPQISQGWMYLKADTGSGRHTASADRHTECTCISAFISKWGKKGAMGVTRGPRL